MVNWHRWWFNHHKWWFNHHKWWFNHHKWWFNHHRWSKLHLANIDGDLTVIDGDLTIINYTWWFNSWNGNIIGIYWGCLTINIYIYITIYIYNSIIQLSTGHTMLIPTETTSLVIYYIYIIHYTIMRIKCGKGGGIVAAGCPWRRRVGWESGKPTTLGTSKWMLYNGQSYL